MSNKIVSFLRNNGKLLRELVLYGVIGGCSSLIDTGFYVFFTRVLTWREFLANFLSVNIGITCSFFLNVYFNFKKTDKLGKRALSFFAVGYCGLGLSMLLLYLGTSVLHINDIVVKIASIVFVAIFQFVLNKLITFTRI